MSELCKFVAVVCSYCWIGFRRDVGGFEEIGFEEIYGMIGHARRAEEFSRRRYTEIYFVGTANRLWGMPLRRAFSLGGRMWFVSGGGSVELRECEVDGILDNHSPDSANCEAAWVLFVIPFRGW